MKVYNEHIDDLIGLVLTGEAGDAEKAELQSWIELDPANAEYFAQMQKLMSSAAAEWNGQSIDVDAAWQKVERATHSETPVVPIRKSTWFRWQYAAAAVFAGIVTTLLVFNRNNQTTELAITTTGEIVTDTLQDDLIATVNRNSELHFEIDQKGNTRSARLSGEAHFRVKHDPAKEFVVETREVFVRDIGTIFNVKSYEQSDSILVTVTEGEVLFYSKADHGVQVKAGEAGIYIRSLKKFEVKSLSEDNELENLSGYADRNFRFRNTPMDRVIMRINEIYEEELILSDEAMGRCRINASFSDEDIDVIVGVIAESMGWQVSKSGKTYTFSGDGCQ